MAEEQKNNEGEAPAEGQQEVKAEPEMVSMKTGDYMIHIYIQTGKNFDVADEEIVNPFIEASTCNIKKCSAAKDGVACRTATIIPWREHLFFEPRNMHKSVIESQVISIRVKNKGFLKDQLIGTYDFDLTKIYGMEKHAVQHQWIALCNPDSAEFNAVSGYLKISVAVQGPGDNQVQLKDQEGPDKEDSQILMPAQVKKEFKQLKIRFIQATNLPKLDTFGTIDAYMKIMYLGKEITTEPVTADKQSMTSDINQEVWLPIQWPLSVDRLVIKLMDHDTGVRDDIAGSMFFSLKKLIEKGDVPGGYFYWQNLYGSPADATGSIANMMNENPEYASTWKGRILMHLESFDEKHPEKKVQELQQEDGIRDLAEANGYWQDREYQIIMEFGMGISLPYQAAFKIKVQIGENEWWSDVPKQFEKKGYNRWSWRLEREKQRFFTKFKNVENMDKIFIYLMDGDTAICYWKGNVKDYENPDPAFQWIVMKADKTVGKVKKDHKAGMIQMKLSVNNIAKNGPIEWLRYKTWKKKPKKRMTACKIRAFIFQCRDVPSADNDGSSDCFITLWNPDGEKYQTVVVEDTLNPIFFQTLELSYDIPDLEDFNDAPPIILNLWDKDTFGKDYLGRSVIYLKDAATNRNLEPEQHKERTEDRDNQIPQPKWHDIHMGFDQSSPATGQVLCSFVIVPLDFDFYKPTKYLNLSDEIPKKEYQVDLNVLGLRELESYGLLPVRKPIVKFRIKSLLPPEKAQAVTNITTEPSQHGPNPNINTCINFTVQLPEEEIYCPALACDVYDYLMAGLSQPLLGTFSIPVGKIKCQYEEDTRNELLEARKILEGLMHHAKMEGEAFKAAKVARLQTQKSKRIDKASSGLAGAQQSKKKVAGGKMLAGTRPGVAKRQVSEQEQTDINDVEMQLIGSQSDVGSQMDKSELSPKSELSANTMRQLEDEAKAEEAEILKKQKTGLASLSQQNQDIFANMLGGPAPPKQEEEKVESFQDRFARKVEEKKLQRQMTRASKRAESKQDEAAKRKEKRDILKEKDRIKQEQKLAKKNQQKIDMKNLQGDDGNDFTDTIIIPDYKWNSEMNQYEQGQEPDNRIYMKVGFNDLQIINEIMDGDDAAKREKKTKKTKNAKKSRSIQDDEPLNTEEAEEEDQKNKQELERRTQKTKQHYRKYYEDELENNKELLGDSPFVTFPVKRGSQRGNSSSFFGSLFASDRQDEDGEVQTDKKVGDFKGRIDVYNVEERKRTNEEKESLIQEIFKNLEIIYQKDHPNEDFPCTPEDLESREKLEKLLGLITKMGFEEETEQLKKFFQNQSNEAVIQKQLLKITTAEIHFYLLEAYDLASRDIGSFSDPYVIVRCGSKEYNERDNYFLDKADPAFNKFFRFTGEFPGAPLLVIECWDFDDIFGDDLIGKTTIDLDDRFFNPDWQALEEKPIEYRDIYHESTSLSQGTIQCWVEIEPNDKSVRVEQKIWDIEPEPVKPYQLRLCIFNATDVPCMDVEGVSDIFIKSYIDDKDKKTTDTHFRCTGEGSWNYRMLFDVEYSAAKKDNTLVLQAWDFDLFKKNDYICEWTIDLKPLFEKIALIQQPINFTKTYYESFHRNHKSQEDIEEDARCEVEFEDDNSFYLVTTREGKQIKLRIDIRLYPLSVAEANPVGAARNDANMEPYLPPPVGRMEFSLNPFKMLSQLMGPALWRKIKGAMCCLICIALCVFMAPMILSDLASKAVLSIFGLD